MKKQALLLVLAVVALGACSKTENGDLVVKRPVDVDVKTTQDTLHPPTVTTKVDTINTPVVGTKKDTIIVNKPVVGTKKTEVKVPVVTKKP
jgi:16S rRNA U516 pseudouridylate synthase RsuA-like enzyme